MLITKSVNLRINNINIKYYSNLYDNLKLNDIIHVDVSNLSHGSHAIVKVVCDKCGTEKEMCYKEYIKYTKNNNGEYYCRPCNKDRREKTMEERYGEKYPMQCQKFKKKIIETNLNKYGKEWALQNCDIKDKLFQTNEKKYGTKYISLNTEVRNKQTITRIKNIVKNIGYEFIDYDFNEHKIKMKCPEGHISDVKATLIYNRKNYNVIVCPICNPVGFQHSAREKELLKFIEDNYNGKILENDKSIINPYELDVYLPDLKLAIEFNGIFWHTIKFKPENYHYDKFDLCKEKGIKLINIWEDDWINKKDAVKILILNNIQNIKISGQIKKVSIKEANQYLKKNHLLGNIKSDIRIGQYDDNNELTSLIVLSKNNDYYNLLREININNELLNFFIVNYNPKQINCLINRSYTNQNMENIGFKIEKTIKSNTFKVIKKRKIKSNTKADIYDEGNYLYCINKKN